MIERSKTVVLNDGGAGQLSIEPSGDCLAISIISDDDDFVFECMDDVEVFCLELRTAAAEMFKKQPSKKG
jgi:hypothetical protein